MTDIIDNGPAPTVLNVVETTVENTNYRTTVWTGNHLQMTVMSIDPGHDIGLEVHPDNDQFLRVEQGMAKVSIGPSKEQMQTWQASASDAVFVPAGMWHNLETVGEVPLKVYSIYSPSHHPHGTVHVTQADSEAAEAAE
jgi:mannose-6-phosphate isomerase-like protein (cupin superfamily)